MRICLQIEDVNYLTRNRVNVCLICSAVNSVCCLEQVLSFRCELVVLCKGCFRSAFKLLLAFENCAGCLYLFVCYSSHLENYCRYIIHVFVTYSGFANSLFLVVKYV